MKQRAYRTWLAPRIGLAASLAMSSCRLGTLGTEASAHQAPPLRTEVAPYSPPPPAMAGAPDSPYSPPPPPPPMAGASYQAPALPFDASPQQAPSLRTLAPSEMCVTQGKIAVGERLLIRDTAVRAVAPQSTGDSARLQFIYRGPTDEQSQLAQSAQVRQQVALKLRAADGCNVLYVTWRIAPKPGIAVAVKRNPQTKSSECGSNGYTRIKPVTTSAVPLIELGKQHSLAAGVSGERLTVRVDNVVVWQGDVPGAATLRGPAGLRTDNMKVDVTFAAAIAGTAPAAAATGELLKCQHAESAGD